jgi:twitching motility protein PilT
MSPVIQGDAALRWCLSAAVQLRASDLHLTAGLPPIVRIDGTLTPVPGADPLVPQVIDRMLDSILSDAQWDELEDRRQVDLSITAEVGRFRVNAYYQRKQRAAAFRLIPTVIPTLQQLRAPEVFARVASQPYGLVLFVGPTGSGKSTSLAAMVDLINASRPCHILTIEDPIEYLHPNRRAVVNQREVGDDCPSFAQGLRAALREDPDVILVGELRDQESIHATLTLAETGHLVFGTLHANDAPQAIDRIVDVFESDRRQQIRTQLGATVRAVVSQRLLRRTAGGRVAAYEVMLASEPVRNLIREGKTHQLRNIIATGNADGMQTLEQDMVRLLESGEIGIEDALGVANYPRDLERTGAMVGGHLGASFARGR